jgi:hypothetical protein
MTTLRELASLPTAAFHEDLTCGYIADFLKKHEIPYEIDRYGNIIAHYKTADCRPLALMAHTDHPAFELVRPDAPAEYPGAHWTARLLGGVARDYFEQPFRVRIFPGNDTSRAVGATGIGYKVGDGGPRDIVLYLKLDEPAEELTEGNFGIWDLPDFELRDGFIHARVIDDLVGCAAGLLALWKAKTENYATNLYGVFTRAEEVGLVGADLLFAAGTLPRETFIVSIEASRTLPRASGICPQARGNRSTQPGSRRRNNRENPAPTYERGTLRGEFGDYERLYRYGSGVSARQLSQHGRVQYAGDGKYSSGRLPDRRSAATGSRPSASVAGRFAGSPKSRRSSPARLRRTVNGHPSRVLARKQIVF